MKKPVFLFCLLIALCSFLIENQVKKIPIAQLIAPGVISTTKGEYHPTFDASRNELFFMRRTPGKFDYTLYSSVLEGGTWTTPKKLPFSGNYRDAAPYISPDGNTLYFDSRRPNSKLAGNAINLWKCERDGENWLAPELLYTPSYDTDLSLKAEQDEFGPAIDANGSLYFYSFRKPFRGGARYVAQGKDFNTLKLDNAIPDPSASTFVSYLYISPDSKLAFMEGRSKDGNDTDIYCACKKENGNWSDAKAVYQVNTSAGEGGPSLSTDGRYLLFASNRNSNRKDVGNADLYMIEASSIIDYCQKE